MLNLQQKHCLAQLPKATLVNFIAEVQGVDKLLDKKIERLLLQSDKPKLIKKLTTTLKGLNRRHKYIDHWKVSEFATELQYLASDIMSLYPEQADTCLQLLELFIESSNTSLQRCDDASGEIGEIYSNLAQSWLMVARDCYNQQKQILPVDEQDILSQAWQTKVKNLIDDNDYGFKDALMAGLKQLLSELEIRGIIDDYLHYYQSLFTENKGKGSAENAINTAANPRIPLSYGHDRANHQEKLKTETALLGVAQALGDVALFIAVYRTIYPQQPLSPQQLNGLVSFMIDHQAYELALEYLNHDWQSKAQQDAIKRLDWLSQIYQQQGDSKAQLKVLGEVFELQSSAKRLQAIMAIASPAEQAGWRKKAYKLAEDQQDIITAILLLLEIGEIKLANQVAITRHHEFADIHYETLTQLLKGLPEDTAIIQMIIYRSLIDDILTNDRSRAYGYAARYYKRLSPLDSTINKSTDGYNSLATHQQYTELLSQKYNERSDFWQRISD